LKEYKQFAVRYTNHTLTHTPPATTTTKLTLLLPYTQQVDSTLRNTYKTVILHGNQTANFQAMSKVHVQEINPELFMTNLHWNSWIHSEYKIALAAGRLCGCKKKKKK